MTFIDTSAIYALADRADPNHERARECFARLVESGEPLLTHNYVILESMALIQRRLGVEVALRLADDVDAFEVRWVTKPLHDEAVEALAEAGSGGVSLVDQVSFLVMQQQQLTTAFAFDADFAARGFRLSPSR